VKWYGVTALISFATLFNFAVEPYAFAENDDSKAIANTVGNAVNMKFGTATGIRDNASQPLSSSGTKLYTIDNTKSSSVQIRRPSSISFLNIIAQPSGTGDLVGVAVYEDLNFDGTSDYIYNVPVPISGVCANGVISCNSGTWTDCKTFKWQSDGSGKIALASTSLDSLGGCYCINSSCGSNLVWDNISHVMQTIGGGVVGGIQSSKAGIVITDVKSDGPSIQYYGQDTTGSSTGVVGSGSVSETSFKASPGSISSATDTMVASQSSDPKSYYSMMATTMENKGSNSDFHTCTQNRQIEVDGPRCTIGTYNPIKQVCEHTFFQQNIGTDVGTFSFSGTATVIAGDTIRFMLVKDYANGCQDTGWSNSVTVNDVSIGAISGGGRGYCWYTGEGSAKIINFNASYEGVYNWSVYGGAYDPGSWWLTSHYKVALDRPYSCTNDEYINDGCAALAANPDCVVSAETVDGVLTYSHYNPTNLIPLPSAKLFGSDICAQTITRDWWTKQKTYMCKTTGFDMSNVGKRVSAISTSMGSNSISQQSFSYSDQRMDTKTGTWSADSGNISIPGLDAGKNCQFVCKTKKLVDSAGIAPSGPTTTYRSSTQSYEFLYKTCDTDSKCPMELGEEMLKDCQCLSEFAEATSILMSLDAASKDLICSDGERK